MLWQVTRSPYPDNDAIGASRKRMMGLYVVMLITTKPRGRNLPETVDAMDVQSRANE